VSKRKNTGRTLTCPYCREKVARLEDMADEDTIDIHLGECPVYATRDLDAFVEVHTASTTPVVATEPVKKAVLGCTECDFTTESKAGLKSHMRKHEAEKADPARAGLDDLRELLRSLAQEGSTAAAVQQEVAKAEAAHAAEIDEVAAEVKNLRDVVIPLLLSVPEAYQDKTRIAKFEKVLAVAVGRLAELQADPRYVRGEQALTQVIHHTKVADKQSEAARLNAKEAEALMGKGNAEVFSKILCGSLLLPSRKFKDGEPLIQRLWFQANHALGEAGIDTKLRTFAVMVPVVKEIARSVLGNYISFADSDSPTYRAWVVDERLEAVVRSNTLVEVPLNNISWEEAEQKVLSMFESVCARMPGARWNLSKAAEKYISSAPEGVAARVGYAGDTADPEAIAQASKTSMQYAMMMANAGIKKTGKGDAQAEQTKGKGRR